MSAVAFLPMYAVRGAQAHADALWNCLRDAIRSGGIEAPERVAHFASRLQGWLHPDLILGQTCGLPYITKLCNSVELVGNARLWRRRLPARFLPQHARCVVCGPAHAAFRVFRLRPGNQWKGFAVRLWRDHVGVRAVRAGRALLRARDSYPARMRPRCDWWPRAWRTSRRSIPSPGGSAGNSIPHLRVEGRSEPPSLRPAFRLSPRPADAACEDCSMPSEPASPALPGSNAPGLRVEGCVAVPTRRLRSDQ